MAWVVTDGRIAPSRRWGEMLFLRHGGSWAPQGEGKMQADAPVARLSWLGQGLALEGDFLTSPPAYKFSAFLGHPDLPLPLEPALLCGNSKYGELHPIDVSVLPDGHLFVVGRCNNGSKGGVGGPLRGGVARWSPGSTNWSVWPLPDTEALGGGHCGFEVYARAVDDVYVFANGCPTPSGHAYLAHLMGADFHALDVPIPGEVWSMTSTPDGSLWVTALDLLWARAPASAWTRIALPEAPDGSPLRAERVLAKGNELWVTARYGYGESRGALLRRGDVGARHLCPW